MESNEIITTLAVVLGAGLGARFLASALRLPEMLVLLGAGAVIGPSVLGWVDVPLDTAGTQVLLTLGVSFIIFHGGLRLSVRVCPRQRSGSGCSSSRVS